MPPGIISIALRHTQDATSNALQASHSHPPGLLAELCATAAAAAAALPACGWTLLPALLRPAAAGAAVTPGAGAAGTAAGLGAPVLTVSGRSGCTVLGWVKLPGRWR
jgi:hypothetical protein